MASDKEFVDYICEQISGAGDISYKKMFGEYGVYCNAKIIGLVCDNMFYVKKTEKGAEIIGACEEASPYTNAKPHFLIESADDKDLMTEFILATYRELPEPKPKKKKVL
ncbi:MAG: TfoX/Sxy family protein [Spirochaetales bacterium]